jgi:predicted PurR-regulated permease PerM
VLVPRLSGAAVGISPLTVLLGILAGCGLFGTPGALVPVPVALRMILQRALGLDRSIERRRGEARSVPGWGRSAARPASSSG